MEKDCLLNLDYSHIYKKSYIVPKLELISITLSLITVGVSYNKIDIEYIKDGGVWNS